MFNAVSFYLLWLTLAGCLIVAAPVLGALALGGGLAIVLKVRR
ncbi:MAG: hypothetical protein QOI21_33 [Actinomycetota bacterium]|nr:hypothetical protein [Actinomycetota bacterium]